LSDFLAVTDVNNRIKLVLLAVALVLPTALAYISYSGFDWRAATQKNYGELLPPTPLANTAGSWMDGDLAGFERTRGKWVLTYVGPSVCEEACRKSLYYMRQARILQDGERHRVELVWVLTDAGKVDDTLLQAVPGLRVWRAADGAFVKQFPAVEGKAGHIYLVDPLGNLMLRFPVQPDAKGMLKDLKLLLKARIG